MNDPLYRLSFGGDTLNTAIYLARYGASVDYVTALGDDHFSARMISAWQQEGVGTELVMQKPNSLPGLYAIQTTEEGERSFYYWRQHSPARTLFEDWPHLFEQLAAYPYLYLSGITLSLYSPTILEQLWIFLNHFRAKGGRVIFDINYRKAGWKNSEHARDVFAKILPLTDIALPSFDDEKALYGEHTKEECLQRYIAAGTTELVIKDGENGCWLYSAGETFKIPIPKKIKPIDTTAAGDSFNGAYIAARLCNMSPSAAVAAGQACAALVIQHRGAIIPRDIFMNAQTV